MAEIITAEEEQFREWAVQKSAANLFALVYGDAAVRCSEIIGLAAVNGYAGFWIAIKLSDGDSDEIAYATKADAIRHQLHEQQCCYVKVPPDGMSPRHAHAFLKMHRALYSAGMRIVDPDQPRRGIIHAL